MARLRNQPDTSAFLMFCNQVYATETEIVLRNTDFNPLLGTGRSYARRLLRRYGH